MAYKKCWSLSLAEYHVFFVSNVHSDHEPLFCANISRIQRLWLQHIYLSACKFQIKKKRKPMRHITKYAHKGYFKRDVHCGTVVQPLERTHSLNATVKPSHHNNNQTIYKNVDCRIARECWWHYHGLLMKVTTSPNSSNQAMYFVSDTSCLGPPCIVRCGALVVCNRFLIKLMTETQSINANFRLSHESRT